MRIGILRADAVSADLAARHGDYPAMFERLLTRSAEADELGFEAFDAHLGRLPETVDACDAYLVTGSRHSVYDDLPWIGPLADFVGEAVGAGRRVVGICFGHQLVAHCFGGETRKAEGGWCVGVHEARIVETHCWMRPPAERVRLLASHQDQVVRLPPRARLFAAGETCPYAGFVLTAEEGGGGVLTLQGHPEFTPAYAGALMDSRADLLGEQLHAAGRASLDGSTEHALVAQWMLEFMGAGKR